MAGRELLLRARREARRKGSVREGSEGGETIRNGSVREGSEGGPPLRSSAELLGRPRSCWATVARWPSPANKDLHLGAVGSPPPPPLAAPRSCQRSCTRNPLGDVGGARPTPWTARTPEQSGPSAESDKSPPPGSATSPGNLRRHAEEYLRMSVVVEGMVAW